MFEQRDGMLRNILTREVPALAAEYAERVLETVLVRAGLVPGDIAAWIMHAGGRDVLLALEKRFELADRQAFRYSAAMLREYGNLSSAFVYFVLEAALADDAPGGWWWLSSFGAGFSCHGALLKVDWSMLPRVLEPETLDQLAPDDPAAQRARRDLRRVNAVHGRAPHPRAGAREGAGGDRRDGRRRRPAAAHPRDRLRRRPPDARGRPAPRRALARASSSTCSTASRSSTPRRSPPMPRRAGRRGRASPTCSTGPPTATSSEHWDVVVANLFLHHFDGVALRRLLAGCARRADALAACEPRRSRFALGASHLIFFLGANAVTRRDGVLSVRAGFVGHELSDAWQAGPPAGDPIAPTERLAARRVRRRPLHPLLLRHADRRPRPMSSAALRRRDRRRRPGRAPRRRSCSRAPAGRSR